MVLKRASVLQLELLVSILVIITFLLVHVLADPMYQAHIIILLAGVLDVVMSQAIIITTLAEMLVVVLIQMP